MDNNLKKILGSCLTISTVALATFSLAGILGEVSVSAAPTTPYWVHDGSAFNNIEYNQGWVGINTNGNGLTGQLTVYRDTGAGITAKGVNNSFFYASGKHDASDGNKVTLGANSPSGVEQDLLINRYGGGNYGSGKVGIGKNNAEYLLDVAGTVRADSYGSVGTRKNLIIGNDVFFEDFDTSNTIGINGMQNSNEGRIRLGKTGPVLYGGSGKFIVDGQIVGKSVKVQQNVWADYVFEDDYYLMSLEELERYISLNGHLPGVPSADEVEGNNVDVAETNRILLEKIEELHLYTLQQEKRLNDLESRLSALESKNQ